jgi:hypothetical protein
MVMGVVWVDNVLNDLLACKLMEVILEPLFTSVNDLMFLLVREIYSNQNLSKLLRVHCQDVTCRVLTESINVVMVANRFNLTFNMNLSPFLK